MEIDQSDLEKIRDALASAEKFLVSRDTANAAVHLAAEVRHSPITRVVQAERERADRLLEPDATVS
jgi:hypothetical protein